MELTFLSVSRLAVNVVRSISQSSIWSAYVCRNIALWLSGEKLKLLSWSGKGRPVTVFSFWSLRFLNLIPVEKLARLGPKLSGLMRRPAIRSSGRDNSSMVG